MLHGIHEKQAKAVVNVNGKMLTVLSLASAKDVVNSVEIFTLFIGLSGTLETSKIERLVTLVHSFQPLTNVTKNSILDVAGIVGK